jgi:hypothetical protein
MPRRAILASSSSESWVLAADNSTHAHEQGKQQEPAEGRNTL